MELYVTRDTAWYGRFRKLRIVLDGIEVGKLASGETKRFEISAGTHELYVQMDWVKSEPVTFVCSDRDTLDAQCTSPRFSFSFSDIFRISVWERASRPFTVIVSRRE